MRALELSVAFVFGAAIGSFLNVCITRWPAGGSIVAPRSRCPKCEAPIAWYDNIPLASWLVLRAKCRHCGARIPVMYPLVELATALVWLGAAAMFGPTVTALRVAVFATVLLGIAVTDARHFLIPDGFTLFGLAWVLVTAIAAWSMGGSAMFASPWNALIGACVGAGAIAIVGWLGEIAFGREAMGFGDVTLMAFAGAALGANRALLTIFLGALLAVVGLVSLKLVGLGRGIAGPAPSSGTSEPATAESDDAPPAAERASQHIPFGVFLAPAAVLALLYGNDLINWYLQWARTGSAP